MRRPQPFVFVAAVAWLCAVVVAQPTAFGQQERARLEFRKLAESMQQLQTTLAETAPDESRVLGAGGRYAQEQRIEERMADVRDLLRGGRWDEALEHMAAVRDDLDVLLKLLLNREVDLDKLKEEIARLEAFKKRVEELIAEQQREKEAAARSEELQKQLEALAAAKEEVSKLIDEQAEVRETAAKSGLAAEPEQAGDMAEAEGELKDRAEALSEELEELEQRQAELDAEPEAKDGKPAEPGPPKSGEGAKGGSGSPSSGGSCAGSCSKASQAMGQAQQKLGQNKPERSLEDMDQALRALEQTAADLERMAEAARRELLAMPFEEQAKAQETTRIDTDRLAQEMEESESKTGDDQPTPGTDNVKQAVPKQKAAAGQLKEYRPGKAKQDQQDAKDALEEAQKELEDALAQLRQQLQDEVLRALEERFGAMLAEQKELSARTIVADRLRAEALTADGSLPAALVARCTELSEGELGLASEAGDALKLLEEEGTTAVFPEIVEELKDDLERVATRVGLQKTAATTQAMQAEIEDTLRMLLDALRRTIEQNEGGGCSSCDGQPPLVPLSAEVKLILQLQKRVAKRTKRYDGEVPSAERGDEAAVTEAGEIARKQGRVQELTRRLADKQNKLETEQEQQ